MIGQLDRIRPENIDMLGDIFVQLDDLEASTYYQTTKTRLDVIDKLVTLTETGEREKVIQKYLYNHLWLLDPSWERAGGTEYMESTVMTALDSKPFGLTEEEKRGRLDIKYTTAGGKHIIIELKRPGVITNTSELYGQISKYRAATAKCLEDKETEGPIEIVCVVGRHLSDWKNPNGRSFSQDSLKVLGARVVMYDSLIENAQKAYREYTEKRKNVTRIRRLIDSIGKDDMEYLSPR